ncbi:MAG: SRPBCC family protein [Proteobacteria bacterium]|nr:SRPBCC family protein [Pseudomonadota bacterium]
MRGAIRHFVRSAPIRATPQEVFDYLDDPERIGTHMSGASLMMAGGSMRQYLDADRGRTVGSVIRMEGRMMGLSLHVEEAITERRPPARKLWETIGPQRMIVIGDYRLGFETEPIAEGTELRVFIDYSLPAGLIGHLLGPFLAPLYARWCVSRITDGTRNHFAAGRRS